MAGNNYSVDDILAEIRRKKENGAGSDESPVKIDSSANGGDFFEMRQKIPSRKNQKNRKHRLIQKSSKMNPSPQEPFRLMILFRSILVRQPGKTKRKPKNRRKRRKAFPPK